VTDPDSRFLHTRKGSVQGYNAQAVVTEQQIVVAAELTQQANDVQQLHPMLGAVDQTLAAAEIPLGGQGRCWPTPAIGRSPTSPLLGCARAAGLAIQDRPHRQLRKRGQPSASRSDGLRAAMLAKLQSEPGKARYAKRKPNAVGRPARQRPRPAGAAARRAERPTHVTGTIRPDPGSSWSPRSRPPAA
jgi:hypothetical protein